MTHNSLLGLSNEQVENLVRVWEKNHVYQKFTRHHDKVIGPELVRVSKVFYDMDLGWCVAFVNADGIEAPPLIYKPFTKFVADYKSC